MRQTRNDAWLRAMLLLTLASGLVVACASENATHAPATSATTTAAYAEDEESAADLHELYRHHHHGGVRMFIAMSLDSLGVSPEQSAVIEKIQGDLFAKMEPAHQAEQNVISVLADGIASGKIDDAKVEVAIDGLKAATTGLSDSTADTLNQLHAALTPEQRAVLVDKVIAHWQVWKAANAQEEKAGDTTHLGQLDWVAKDLSLRPDQVEKIRATFAASLSGLPRRFDSAQAQAHIDELATAFKAPTFDAKTLQHAPFVNQHLALWGARRMASFYEAIDPLLTGDQRTKLSAELKLHATAKSGVFDAEKHER